jgi:choline-sulfatase
VTNDLRGLAACYTPAIMARCWATTVCGRGCCSIESAVKVPLLFRVPGLTKSGARLKTLVGLASVVPTPLDLCRVPVPPGLDERSLASDLREPTTVQDTTVYSEHALHSPRAKAMIRSGDFKYSHYVNDTAELFDLHKDPEEMKNLALFSGVRGRLFRLIS